MLLEFGIKLRYTACKNGEVSRTIRDDLIEGAPSTISITSPMNS